MKIFTKLFFAILIMMTVTLSAVRYYSVTSSFEAELDTAVQGALKQHRLISYSALADMNNMEALTDMRLSSLIVLSDLISSNFETKTTLELLGEDHTGETGILSYSVIEDEGVPKILVESIMATRDNKDFLKISTETDISRIYNETNDLSSRYNLICFTADVICAVLAAVLAFSVTGPIRKLSRASKEMAAGNYELKIPVRRNDEIGELSKSFNKMKDSVTETMDKLELASRQKDDFVGNFAHELKTPMTSIIGYADVIYSGNLNEDEMREAAGYILNEGMRLESLAFKLLELITVTENKFVLEDTDTKAFFDDTEQTIIPAAVKKNMHISFDCESAYIRIEYDLFKTMVMNLIDNAFKSGGSHVWVTGRKTDQGYKISIRDNGRGIPEEEISRITEAFYMIDKARSRSENGAGLGLALCERVARLHNSTLKFESKVGEGTTVSFTVSLSREAEDEAD